MNTNTQAPTEAERQALLKALSENDANGCYTDEDCDAEGLPRLTYDQALALYESEHEKRWQDYR